MRIEMYTVWHTHTHVHSSSSQWKASYCVVRLILYSFQYLCKIFCGWCWIFIIVSCSLSEHFHFSVGFWSFAKTRNIFRARRNGKSVLKTKQNQKQNEKEYKSFVCHGIKILHLFWCLWISIVFVHAIANQTKPTAPNSTQLSKYQVGIENNGRLHNERSYIGTQAHSAYFVLAFIFIYENEEVENGIRQK